MARNQISRTKIGFFFVFIFGVSFYLFASLEESNVMAFLIPLDVSEEKVQEEIDTIEENCYQDVSIRTSEKSFTTTLSCYHIDELKKLGVSVTSLSLPTEDVPLPDKQFIELPSYQPQCPIIQSIRTADVSQCNFISNMESGRLLMPNFISHIPTSSAQESLDELNDYGKEYYGCRDADWVTTGYSATCHGYGALNHQALATVKGYHKPYLLSQLVILEKLVEIEEKKENLLNLIQYGGIYCDVSAQTAITYTDDTQSFFNSKKINVGLQRLDLADFIGDEQNYISHDGKTIKVFDITPSIKCNDLVAPFTVNPSELTFAVTTTNANGDIFETFSTNMPSASVKVVSNADTPIVTFNLPANYVLASAENGKYQSEQTIYIGGTLELSFEGISQKSKIELPIQSPDMNDLRVSIDTEISKNRDVVGMSPMTISKLGDTEIDPSMYDSWNAFASSGQAETEALPLDVINDFTTILFTGEYDKLNNSKFNTIYIVIFLLVIMGIVATRRARTVLIYR